MTEKQNEASHYDVVIVGGGVSGIYSGWRLIGADGSEPTYKSIAVCERSNRIGGRLDSFIPPKMPNLRAELGGMRYMSTHDTIRSLVEDKLKLNCKPFSVGDEVNLNYLRGSYLRNSDYADSKLVPYDVSWDERNMNPSELIVQAIASIVPNAQKLTEKEWEDVKKNGTLDGIPFYELGFWNVVSRALSMEGYSLAVDGGGYDLTLSNWNAAEAMPWFLNDFTGNPEYRTPVNGYMEVPTTLAEQFSKAGGEIKFQHELKGFEYNQQSKKFTLTFKVGNETQVMTADHLILAMPRRSLEIVATGSPLLNLPKVKELLKSVTPIPMFKLFMCYEYPWYKRVGVSKGKSTTDLPLRQCYYFGTVNEQDDVPDELKQNINSLVMATYDDGRNVAFWAGLRDRDQHAGCFDYSIEPTDENRWNQHLAPQRMIDEAQRQLKKMHNMEYVPSPYSATFQYWGDDPYGGAVNYWNVGVKAWEVSEEIIQPLQNVNGYENVPLYIAGEAYSHNQGWVEGALQTAENILQNKFHLSRPAWVNSPLQVYEESRSYIIPTKEV